MNTSGGGKTIIEALEGQIGRDYTSDFGIALMTPDDVGYSKKEGPERTPRPTERCLGNRDAAIVADASSYGHSR